MILVRAIQEGHYGEKYRMTGDEFEIADEQAFSKRWMEKVHKPSAKIAEKVAETKAPVKKKAVRKATEPKAE